MTIKNNIKNTHTQGNEKSHTLKKTHKEMQKRTRCSQCLMDRNSGYRLKHASI